MNNKRIPKKILKNIDMRYKTMSKFLKESNEIVNKEDFIPASFIKVEKIK